MNRERLYRRLLAGSLNNVAFADFTNLIEGFGFKLERVTGSHHIYRHPVVRETINIQPLKNDAKPYQIRQFMRLVEQHRLRMDEGT